MPRLPLTITEAVELAKGAVNSLSTLVVTGEVSGFKGPHYRSGHCYFELKDESSTLSLILWRSVYQQLDFQLKDGLTIQVRGTFDVFGRTGRLSFIARSVELSGEGQLRSRVARLAKRLAAEGLMADEAKRPIPLFCERVVLVTSLSGSVRADVLRTLARRNPLVEVDVIGCAVQGTEAPVQIVHALRLAASTGADALLLVRGGGSYEDLMAFNDERVARAIAESPLPVVTGIGHEPDVTIADLVADRRQSTPTAAAESVAPAFGQLAESLDALEGRLTAEMEGRLRDARGLAASLGGRLPRALVSMVERRREQLDALARSHVLTDPGHLIRERSLELDRQDERMADALPRCLERQGERVAEWGRRLDAAGRRIPVAPRQRLEGLAGALEALNPWGVLRRGYAILRRPGGGVVCRAADAQVGEGLSVLLSEGRLGVSVTSVEGDAAPSPDASVGRDRGGFEALSRDRDGKDLP